MKRKLLTLAIWLLVCPFVWAAGEIQYRAPALTGQTLYFYLRAGAGHAETREYWDGNSWEPLDETTPATWLIAMTETDAGTGLFVGTLPAAATGNVVAEVIQDADDNGTPVYASDIHLADVTGFWNGTIFGDNALVSDGTGTGQIDTASGVVLSTGPFRSTITGTPSSGDTVMTLVGGPETDSSLVGWQARFTDATAGEDGGIAVSTRTVSAYNYDSAVATLTIASTPDFDLTGNETVELIPPGFASADRTAMTAIDDYVDGEVAAVKAKTDQLTFTVANVVDSNVTHVEEDDDVLLNSFTSFNATVILDTTISSVTSQLIFRATDGSSLDDTYNGRIAYVYDDSNSDFPWPIKISDYTGATREYTLSEAPGFTIVAGDALRVFVDISASEVASLASDMGGPIEQREVAPSRRLQVRSRGDGTFGVIGRVRMIPGETALWSVDLRGTQVAVNHNLHGMSTPTFTGAQGSNMTLVDHGVDDAEAKFEVTLSGSAATSDVINVRLVIQPTSAESIIVVVPVTVGS